MIALRCLLPFLVLSLTAPASAQEKLLAENVMAIQDALVWTGDYEGALDGSLGGATLTALKQFQTREGRPAKGRASNEDVKRLAAFTEAAKRAAGWSVTLDGRSDVVAWLPRAILPVVNTGPDGRAFASADGATRLVVFAADEAVAALHKAARDKAGRSIEREQLKKARSIVTGTEDGRGFFDFAAAGASGSKGFRLSYPASEAARLRPMAIAIANSFIAAPGAPVPKKAARAVPSFIGAFRFADAERPYSYGMIDVETRETTIVSGDVAANLTATEPPPPPDAKPRKRKRRPEFDAPFVPKLQIFVAGEQVLEVADADWITHFADVRLVELDPANRQQEVMLTFYNGGAHCCTVLTIFSARADGSWARIEGGAFDGSPDFARDLDGDGRYELVNTDNAFLGAFDCYACSYAPVEIRQVTGETITNVSGDARFHAHHSARLGEIWNWGWQSAAIPSEGFLAGFVAAASRTGQSEDAWAFLKAHHVPRKGAGNAPFPERLRAFLEQQNY